MAEFNIHTNNASLSAKKALESRRDANVFIPFVGVIESIPLSVVPEWTVILISLDAFIVRLPRVWTKNQQSFSENQNGRECRSNMY